MSRINRAIMFAGATGADSSLHHAIEENGFVIASPTEAEDVSLVIIDRPAVNAVKICGNLRGQDEFFTVPILVLLDPSDTGSLNNFSTFNADILIKPVTDRALCNYLAKVVSSRSDRYAGLGELGPSEMETYTEEVLETDTAPGLPASDISADTPAGAGQFIADLIPVSNNLLPRTVPSATLTKGGVVCRSCRAWECRKEDAFCSRCGAALAVLELAQEVVSFEPLGEHSVGQLLTFRSSGQNPVRMSFAISARDDLQKRFSLHAREAILESGGTADLLVYCDARGLDLSTTNRAVLEITTNEEGRPRRPVELIVERLAIPAVITQESYSFVLGVVNYWEVKLANEGGGTLSLASADLDGSDLSFDGPIQVKGGQVVSVQLLVPDLEFPVGETVTGTLTFEFGRHSPVSRNISITSVRPPPIGGPAARA